MIKRNKMIKVLFGLLLSVSSIINGINGYGCKCEPTDKITISQMTCDAAWIYAEDIDTRIG